MNDNFQPIPEQSINDIETLKVIADTRRLAILKMMRAPMTVKAISAELEVPPSKLYYHVNLLEKHGLIRVIDHNIESGIVEKIYQATADQIRVVNPLLMEDVSAEQTDALLTPLIDRARAQFRQSLANGLRDDRTPPRYPFLSQKAVRLTKAQLTELHTRLDTLMQSVAAMNEETDEHAAATYELTTIFYKTLA